MCFIVFCFKMCYSVFGKIQKPHCTKKRVAFYGAAKIDKLFDNQSVFVKKKGLDLILSGL